MFELTTFSKRPTALTPSTSPVGKAVFNNNDTRRSRSRDQRGLFVLACSALVLSISYWFYLDGHRGGLIEIERASPLQAKFLVDVNEATWPEIIQLPGVGEVLAQRIITDRRDNGPFHDVDELVRVDGIGPKTLEKIRPYLMPIPQDTDWADVGSDTPDHLQ